MTGTAIAATDAARHTIGANKGPLLVKADLIEANEARFKELDEALGRASALPAEVESDEQDGDTTDVVRLLQNLDKNTEKARVDTKAPFLTAERLVDSFYKVEILDKIRQTKAILEGRLTVYKRKKAESERRRLLAEAQAAKEAAAAAAAEAARERQEAALAAAFDESPAPLAPQHMGAIRAAENAALDAAYDARNLEKKATVKTADLTRNRGAASGAASTMVESWKFEITDLTQISLEALRDFIPRGDIEKAVGRYVTAHKGDKPLAGVRIYSEENARVYY